MGLIKCLNDIGFSDKGVQERLDTLVRSGKTLLEAEAIVKIDFIQNEFKSATIELNKLKKELKLPLSKPMKISSLDFDAINKEYKSSITPAVSLERQAAPEVAAKEAKVEFSNPQEATRYAIENSNDPDEIASIYFQEETPEPDYKVEGIMEYMGGKGKINERDWRRYNDINNLSPEIRKRFIDKDNKQIPLDTSAQELSNTLGVPVSEEDFINTIIDFNSQKDYAEAKKSPNQREAEIKYKELTGKNLTAKRAEDAFFRVMNKPLTDREIYESNQNLQEIGITYEDIERYNEFNQQESDGAKKADRAAKDDAKAGRQVRRKGKGVQEIGTKKVSELSQKEIDAEIKALQDLLESDQLDKIITEFEGQNLSNNSKSYIDKVSPILKALFPKTKFIVYETAAEYVEKTGRSLLSAGVFDRDNNSITLNMELINEYGVGYTVFHEAIHPIVDAVYRDNPKALAAAIEKIIKIKNVKGVEKVFENARAYKDLDKKTRQIEAVTEFLSLVADGKINAKDISVSTFTKIKDAFNAILKALGINYKISTAEDLVRLSEAIKESFQSKDPSALADVLSGKDLTVRGSGAFDSLSREEAEARLKELIAAKEGAEPATTMDRVLGALKDITNISKSEKLKVISKIRKLSKDAAKDLAKEIRAMASSGKITVNQAANIVARLGKVNMLSEISVSKFVDYMAKVFANAEYAAKLSAGKSLKKDISKLSKNNKKNANLRDLGSKFIKIDPSMVDDIDSYNDMASKIKEAINGSKTRLENVKFADIVNIKNATEYINKEIESQDKKIAADRIAEIQSLMDIDASELSADQMLALLESDKPITEYNEGIIRDTINNAFKIYSSIIKNTINNEEDVFTGEDIAFTKNEKRVITEFMAMDLNVLTPKEALMAVDALANFLQNKSIAKMDTVIAEYTALVNGKKLVKEGIKARLLRKYGVEIIGKFLAEQTTTLPVLFEKMFPGVNRAGYVMDMMGLTKLINKASAAKTEAKNIVNDYIKEFYKKKANGQAFNTVDNNIERGMAARLIRTVIGTEAEMQEEFDRRKEILKESIAMLSEGNEKEVAKSILYQKAYDKIAEDATNIQEVRDRVDKTNLEAIDFWIKNWGDRYEQFSEVSEGVYNTVLERELNYTPDKLSLLSLDSESIQLGDKESAFHRNTGQAYDKKSGTLNKVTKPGAKEIRKANRYLDLSFDQNMANLMQDALIDVNTAAPIKQVNAFLNSPDFRKIFPNQDDAKIIKGDKNTIGRVQLYVNNLRNKNEFTSDQLSSIVKKLDKLAAIGVGQALASAAQPFKQVIPVALNTLINSGSLPDVGAITNIDKINFINNSGRAIANRGSSSQLELESINKLIEKAASSTGTKAVDLLAKANAMWIDYLLVKPDIAVARASWLAYYEQSLKKQGIDTSGLDYKTHELNDQAADYASRQVDRQQNISDHDLAGKLFLSKDAGTKIFVKTMMAFASFRMNAASRLGADLTTLNDKTSTKEDKITAARSIAGFGAELAMFKMVAIGASILVGNIYQWLSGDDEEENERKKRIALAYKAQRSSIPSDILSPLPIFDPFVQEYLAAPMLDKVEELIDAPVSIYASQTQQSIFSKLGVLGIAGDRAIKIIELGNLAATGKYTDDYGKEYTISEEKREKLAPFIPLSIASSIGLLPQEGNTIAMAAMRDVKKKSDDTALTIRALDRWASNVDLSKVPQVAEFIKSKKEELSGEGDREEKIKERNELEKSLLGEYENKTQMLSVDPELYKKNFGANSDWVKSGYIKDDLIESKFNSVLNQFKNIIEVEDLKKKKGK